MAGIGPARPMEHQLNPNFNKTPGVYSLPGGATAGNKHLHAAQAAAPAAGQMVRGRKGLVHPSKAAALEAKHGTYLKLQKDIAERKKAERDELIKRAKGAKMGETVMTKFEEESKEYRDVRTSLFSRAERAQTEHMQFLNVSRPSLFAGTRQKARPAAQGAGEQNQPSDRLCA